MYLASQAAIAAKHPSQIVCPNNPTGKARPWRAWLRSDYVSCSWEFATRDEAIAYLAGQVARSPLDLTSEHDRSIDRLHYAGTFLQNCDSGEVFSLADIGLAPCFDVPLPPKATPMTQPKYRAVWRDRLFLGCIVLGEGSLNDCRKAIAARIREERWRGSRFAALWADKPVHKLKAGDSVAVHIGKNGYHLWARYSLERASFHNRPDVR